MRQLVSLVVERGLATFIEVEAALKKQGVFGGDLVSYLLDNHTDRETGLTALLAETLEIPACNPSVLATPKSAAFSRVPSAIAKKYLALPFGLSAGELLVAVSDTPTEAAQSALAAASGCKLRFYAAPVVRIWQGLVAAYDLVPPTNWKRIIGALPIGPQKMIVLGSLDNPPQIVPKSDQPTPPTPRAAPASQRPALSASSRRAPTPYEGPRSALDYGSSDTPPERPSRIPSQRPPASPSTRPARAPSQRPPPSQRPAPSPSQRPIASPSQRPAPSPSQRPAPVASQHPTPMQRPAVRPSNPPPPPRPSPEDAGPSEPVIEMNDLSDEDIEDILHSSTMDSELLVVSGPHSLPRPRQNSEGDLPKVMVAHDPEHAHLVDEALHGGDSGSIAIAKLRVIGVPALFAIMDRFPGPTACDRTTMLSKLPGPSSAGPLVSLVHSMGRMALQDLLARTSDALPETRFWSLYLLSFMLETSMVPALLPRLLDSDVSVRKMAHKLTHILVQHRPQSIAQFVEPLITIFRDYRVDVPQRVRAVTTLGDLRATRAVAALIEVTRYPEKDIALAANEALINITCHDPVTGGVTWPQWYASFGKLHRLEWLIDALMSDQIKLRESAFGELRARTGVAFGFSPKMAKVEREHVYKRYLEWWKIEGAAKFGGSTL